MIIICMDGFEASGSASTSNYAAVTYDYGYGQI